MNNSFGAKLKELRLERGLTQEQVAQIFNVSKTTICQYETKKQEPSLDLLSSIAIFFKTTTDYLLGLEDESGNKIHTNNINTYNNYGTQNGDVIIK